MSGSARPRRDVVSDLKRRLRPLKPILGPVWRGSQRAAARATMTAGRLRDQIADSRRRSAGTERPIRALRPWELANLAATLPYYQPRTGYLGVAGKLADDLIRRHALTSALELGPAHQSLIVGADVMDIRISPNLQTTGQTFTADATKRPWPFPDKAYDLFVAFQVFEHLGTGQVDAFREVRRVARHAILSVPIDWEMEDPRNCHHQISHERALEWFAPVVPSRVVEGNGGRRRRLIYVFEDLPAA